MTTKQKPRAKNKRDVRVAGATSKLRHFRLVGHHHTGKLLPHRHTSHLALACLLAIVGVIVALFQFGILQDVAALPPPVSRNVNVKAIVPGPPPSVGATITSPLDNAMFNDQSIIEISGTCAPDTFVVVSSNNSIVGSTMCTSVGIFSLQAQLTIGQNVLSAKNYDTLDQAGPDTPTVTITLTVTQPPEDEQEEQLVVKPVVPTLPANPSIIPALVDQGEPSKCDQYKTAVLPASKEPRIAVVCSPRSIDRNTQYALGVLVWGGTAPYAFDIDWGDDDTPNTLISLAAAGYTEVPFRYGKSGVFSISIKLKDKNGMAGFVQTATSVNGEPEPFLGGIRDSILRISWFETPVPLYFLAVALTLGFWAGDIFDRRYGITKHYRRTRKSA